MTSRQILQKFMSEFEGLIEKFVRELTESMTFSTDEIGEIWKDFEGEIDYGKSFLEGEMSLIFDEAERREDEEYV